MTVFACSGCDTVLTAPVTRVALPVLAHHVHGNGVTSMGVLMEPGTFAVDPEHYGPPWRRWAEVGADEARARGLYAPVFSVSDGPSHAVVLAPGDVRGTVFIPERNDGFCCGLDGRDGPNLACVGCGRPVATRIDDCSLWQAVWVDPRAVHRLDDVAGPPLAVAWEAVRQERAGTPPAEPSGLWSPLWEAAVGAALARILAASGGRPVTVPDGPVAETFRRSLDLLLPTDAPARSLVLAGPGLPSVPTDLALVPRHPVTGETWVASRSADAVPLEYDVWRHLAFHHGRWPVPGAAPMPDLAFREDPPPFAPTRPFRPDRSVFLRTLARLPAVREPWLRDVYDHVVAVWEGPFW
ncbi:hypothetical protein GCM10009682_55390 [Luedemannella flava]|uniref:Uncharacterized protein n=1 Tax=Luedemannella flava TaxID=349316 RepID=A0ABN2MJC0_9ACTN